MEQTPATTPAPPPSPPDGEGGKGGGALGLPAQDTERPRGWSRRAVPWVLWGVLLALWTFALLRPVPPKVHEVGTPTMRFYAAKGLHLSAYGFLAIAACWLPSRRGVRAATLALLLAHAALSEYGQTFVPGRSGTVADVALNAAGILLGAGAGMGGRWLLRRATGGRV